MAKKTRVRFDVYVDLDPTPGEFHSKESAQNVLRSILNDRISHYNPMVSLGQNHDQIVAGQTAKTIFKKLREKGMTNKDIADLLDLPESVVRPIGEEG